MRPRVFPAEDAGAWQRNGADRLASMRPRVFPAEDALFGRPSSKVVARYNEAAGIPRGRRPRAGTTAPAAGASMRPRVFPAEDTGAGNDARRRKQRFNEAAGIPRGRHGAELGSDLRLNGFNEAAGIPRGRRRGLSAV